jgi:hypothetical protein
VPVTIKPPLFVYRKRIAELLHRYKIPRKRATIESILKLFVDDSGLKEYSGGKW